MLPLHTTQTGYVRIIQDLKPKLMSMHQRSHGGQASAWLSYWRARLVTYRMISNPWVMHVRDHDPYATCSCKHVMKKRQRCRNRLSRLCSSPTPCRHDVAGPTAEVSVSGAFVGCCAHHAEGAHGSCKFIYSHFCCCRLQRIYHGPCATSFAQ